MMKQTDLSLVVTEVTRLVLLIYYVVDFFGGPVLSFETAVHQMWKPSLGPTVSIGRVPFALKVLVISPHSYPAHTP